MSLVKSNMHQLGQSATATQNFTLDASAANGTMKLSRGNAGATSQDILTISALGEIDFPQMVRSFGVNGYYKFPGGLILQWGICPTQIAISSTLIVSLPITFPNSFLHGLAFYDQLAGTGNTSFSITKLSLSQVTIGNGTGGASTPSYFVLGY